MRAFNLTSTAERIATDLMGAEAVFVQAGQFGVASCSTRCICIEPQRRCACWKSVIPMHAGSPEGLGAILTSGSWPSAAVIGHWLAWLVCAACGQPWCPGQSPCKVKKRLTLSTWEGNYSHHSRSSKKKEPEPLASTLRICLTCSSLCPAPRQLSILEYS